uniref:SERTA domain-containing protein n=2 Tax=Steinernema glaseri TaxID=37863 RepID=A0A1I7ZF85_9BILA
MSSSPSMDSYIESELCSRVLELTYAKIQNRPRKSNLRRSLMIYNVMIKAKAQAEISRSSPRTSLSVPPPAPVAVAVAKPAKTAHKKAERKVDGPMEYRVRDLDESSKRPRWYHRLLQLPFATEAVEEALAAEDASVVPELCEDLFAEEEEDFDAPPTVFQSDSSSSDEEEEEEEAGRDLPGRKRKTSDPRLSTAEKRYCSFENVSELEDDESEEDDCDCSAPFFRGRSQSAPIYGCTGYGRVTDQLVPGANLQVASCH